MTKSIYNIMKEERERKGLVEIPYMIERMAASIGAHIINLRNLELHDTKPALAMYDSGELECFRLHINTMAPSGFGKSTMYRMQLDPHNGLCSKSDYMQTSVQTTFSPESWMGTQLSNKAEVKTQNGIFERFKRGIIGADEFMRFVGMMNKKVADEYSNEEAYLLTALQHDNATKNLSTGPIEVNGIGTTLWVGSRITSIDMRHGLARRALFQIFIPTPKICHDFRVSQKKAERRQPIQESVKDDVASAIGQVVSDLEDIRRIDYTQFYDWADSTFPNDPHFEIDLLKRIAVGFTIARNTLPDIIMDDAMEGILKDEMSSRMLIRGNPEFEIVRKSISESDAGEISGKELKTFMSKWYQFTDEHITKVIRGMTSRGMLQKNKDKYFLPGSKPKSGATSLRLQTNNP